MERKVPIWLLLFVLLAGLISVVMFGWLVKTTLMNWSERGAIGEAAYEIASFPDLTVQVIGDVAASADYEAHYADLRGPLPDIDLNGFEPVAARNGIEIEGLRVRRSTGSQAAAGWRVLVGTFRIGGELRHAALLIGPDLAVRHYWPLSEPAEGDLNPTPMHRTLVHGFDILPDASVIAAFTLGVTLQRVDRCGRRLWVTPGHFHHAVTLSEDRRSLWALRYAGDEEAAGFTVEANEATRNFVTQIDVSDGRILREFSMQEVIEANPETDVLALRRHHDNDSGGNAREMAGSWMFDPFHLNDVDPLPAALADRFEGFEAGDLLLSARSLNLIFVVDPDTLEIRWWRMGATVRQHDPDWLPTGEISVYNNRMTRGRSQILAIDPARYSRRVVFDEPAADFYSRIRGTHQHLPGGNLLVTSPQQGRAFEVAPDGEIVLEFLNVDPRTEGMAFVMSEARWLPANTLRMESAECD